MIVRILLKPASFLPMNQADERNIFMPDALYRTAALPGTSKEDSLLVELFAAFFEAYPAHAGQLHRALWQRDSVGVCQAARGLMRSLKKLGAMQIAQLAQRIEEAGRRQEWAAAEEALRLLRERIDAWQQLLVSSSSSRERPRP